MRSSANVLLSMGSQSLIAQQASVDMAQDSERMAQQIVAMDARREYPAASQSTRGCDAIDKRKKST